MKKIKILRLVFRKFIIKLHYITEILFYIQILIFPSHDCTNVHGIFDNHIKLQRTEESKKPRGYNEGTLLTYRLNEIENVTSELDESHHQPYTLDNLPIKRAVFIDSTWNQCRGIYKDTRLNSLPTVVLQNRLSQFWRHQKDSPRWFLSTIEGLCFNIFISRRNNKIIFIPAIHQFLVEVHTNAWGLSSAYRGLHGLDVDIDPFKHKMVEDHRGNGENTSDNIIKPYDGQYDNLLFFFTHMYKLIHTYYDHNDLKAYKRPVN